MRAASDPSDESAWAAKLADWDAKLALLAASNQRGWELLQRDNPVDRRIAAHDEVLHRIAEQNARLVERLERRRRPRD